MNNAFDIGVVAGMSKIAVTMRDLRRAARGIKTRLPEPGTFAAHMGGMRIPGRSQQKGALGRAGALALQEQQKHMVPKNVRDMAEGQILPYMKENRRLAKKMHEGARMRPQILYNPKAVDANMRPTSGRNRKNLRALTKIHEAHEGVKFVGPGSLHAHPETLLREMNLMQNLRGRGAKGVQQTYGKLRKPEYDEARKQLVSTFGQRAEQFTRPGAKIPRAMRKAMRSHPQRMSAEKMQEIMAKQQRYMSGQ